MPKAKNTEESSADVEVESRITDEPTQQDVEKLDIRDALEVAIKGTEEDAPKPAEAKPIVIEEEKPQPKYQPPAEWDAEDKQLFFDSSEAQQQAALKLHNKRNQTIEEIKREKAELHWVKELEKEVTPYLKAMGEKRPTHEALVLALKMHKEFNEGNPEEAAAAYLRAKGRPIPKELLEVGSQEKNLLDEKIAPLQNELNQLKQERVQEKTAQVGQ